MSVERASCRSCFAKILWVYMQPSGNAMPVDVKADPKGRLVLTLVDNEVQARHATPEDPPGLRFTSHFATCPMGKEWRKE